MAIAVVIGSGNYAPSTIRQMQRVRHGVRNGFVDDGGSSCLQPCPGRSVQEAGMWIGEWSYGPFGLDAAKGQTFPVQRTVLVAVHSVTAGTRLADVWPLLEPDPRVQLVFTRPPDVLTVRATDQFLAGLDGVVIPWQQAVQQKFDLAIAASSGHLDQVRAPVFALPHGIGFSKLNVRYAGSARRHPWR